jgi:hypothetical protein
MIKYCENVYSPKYNNINKHNNISSLFKKYKSFEKCNVDVSIVIKFNIFIGRKYDNNDNIYIGHHIFIGNKISVIP